MVKDHFIVWGWTSSSCWGCVSVLISVLTDGVDNGWKFIAYFFKNVVPWLAVETTVHWESFFSTFCIDLNALVLNNDPSSIWSVLSTFCKILNGLFCAQLGVNVDFILLLAFDTFSSWGKCFAIWIRLFSAISFWVYIFIFSTCWIYDDCLLRDTGPICIHKTWYAFDTSSWNSLRTVLWKKNTSLSTIRCLKLIWTHTTSTLPPRSVVKSTITNSVDAGILKSKKIAFAACNALVIGIKVLTISRVPWAQ